LLTLAIVDDIGAILVIAFFYTEHVSAGWLATAAVLLVSVAALRMLRVWYIPLYVILGCGLWLATFESGLHATIAGVVLGLITPAKPIQSEQEARAWAEWLREKGDEVFSVDVRFAAFHMRESVSVAERIGTALHPITSFVIIPVFALANAGVPLGGGVIGDAASSAVTWGVIAGLVLGKTVGVFTFTWCATKLGWGSLPPQMRLPHLLGVASISGVGFTVSLFVTSLSFENQQLIDQAKIGILAASAFACVLGLGILWWASRGPQVKARPAGEVDYGTGKVNELLGEREPLGVG
jgi:NhaA family Na+:H+ antiporter